MVTACIFTLREVMRKVQSMYGISSHGIRHTNPDDKEEIKRLTEYLRTDKVQEFCRNRDGNDEIAPVSDLMADGAAYGDTAKAYRNFTNDQRVARNLGVPESAGSGEPAVPAGTDAEGEAMPGIEGEEGEDDADESAEGIDLGDFGVMEEDLGVDDEEFSELADTFLSLAMSAVDGE